MPDGLIDQTECTIVQADMGTFKLMGALLMPTHPPGVHVLTFRVDAYLVHPRRTHPLLR